MFQTNTMCSARLLVTVNRNIQLDCWMSVYMWYSFLAAASKLLNLKHDRGAATRQSSRVHWCEHLSPMWTLAQMWHAGSGHMRAFHPSSLCSYWCCEYTSHDCWLWQHSDSHNPHKRSGQALSPGQARPPLHNTVIDLMDCVPFTPLPQTNSPPKICLHWDKEAVPALLLQRNTLRPPEKTA